MYQMSSLSEKITPLPSAEPYLATNLPRYSTPSLALLMNGKTIAIMASSLIPDSVFIGSAANTRSLA